MQNLRSALDHLANELVVAEGNTPGSRTAFPLFEDRLLEQNGKTAERNLWVSGGIDLRALALIEEAQPYHRVEDPTAHPLWVLRELSNVDKHRLPILVAEGFTQHRIWVGLASGGGGSFPRHGAEPPRVRRLERGAYLAGVGVGAPSFQTYPYVTGEVFPRIAFGEGEACPLQPVTDVLQELTKGVRAVIDSLRLFAYPPSFRPEGLPNAPEIPPEAIARTRAITEARGEIWPWIEGPLAVPADTEWLAHSGIPPEMF